LDTDDAVTHKRGHGLCELIPVSHKLIGISEGSVPGENLSLLRCEALRFRVAGPAAEASARRLLAQVQVLAACHENVTAATSPAADYAILGCLAVNRLTNSSVGETFGGIHFQCWVGLANSSGPV